MHDNYFSFLSETKQKPSQAAIEVLLLFVVATFLFSGVKSTIFTIKNKCGFTKWPATLNSYGSQSLPLTGFELASGASQSIHVIQPWSGRLWGRSHCSMDSLERFSCSTGDCSSGLIACEGGDAIPPATLVEITLASNGRQDFYDISLVDGFNLSVTVTPLDGSKRCNSNSCPTNINEICPQEMTVKASKGSVIAWRSACLAFNQPQYNCCTDEFNSPASCQSSDYSRIFKKHCPKAYSYTYDDKTSTFICNDGGTYEILFCP